jgi:hypothetical protein
LSTIALETTWTKKVFENDQHKNQTPQETVKLWEIWHQCWTQPHEQSKFFLFREAHKATLLSEAWFPPDEETFQHLHKKKKKEYFHLYANEELRIGQWQFDHFTNLSQLLIQSTNLIVSLTKPMNKTLQNQTQETYDTFPGSSVDMLNTTGSTSRGNVLMMVYLQSNLRQKQTNKPPKKKKTQKEIR